MRIPTYFDRKKGPSRFLVDALIATVIAAAVWRLHHWIFRPDLKELFAKVMKFNTALALLIAGVSLWLQRSVYSPPKNPQAQFVGKALAFVVLLIGGLTLSEYLLGTRLGIDELFVTDLLTEESREFPGRMSPIAAGCFVLLGLSLSTLNLISKRRRLHPPSFFLVPLLLLSLLSVVGYIFDSRALYQFGPFIRIAWQTAACFLALGLAAVLARPERGLGALIMSPTSGGLMARRMLPAAIILPALFGWIRLHAQLEGYVDLTLGLALLVVTWSAAFSLFILINARKLSLLDEDREKNEARLRHFVEQSPYAVAMLDKQMRYVFASTKWLADYRLKTTELAGKSHYKVFPETSDKWRAVYKRCLAGATERNDREEFQQADGHVNWLRWEIRPWRDQNDEIGGILIFNENVSERVHEEEKRRASEARFKGIFDSAMFGLIFWNDKGEIFDANDEFLRMVGYSREDLRRGAINWRKMTPPEYAPLDVKSLHEFATIGRCTPYEKDYIHKDGSRISLLVGGATLPDVPGTGGIGFILDNSARKKAELSLKTSEHQLSLTFTQAGVGIGHMDPQGRWIKANPQLCEITGYTETELIGMSFQDMTHPEDLARGLTWIERIQAGKTDNNSIEKRFIRKDDSIVWVSITDTLVRKNGAPDYFIRFVEDISKRKTFEEERNRYVHLFQSAAWGMSLALSNNTFLEVNPAFADMHGGTPDEWRGQSLLTMFADETKPLPPSLTDAAARTGPIVYESVHVRKDRSKFPVLTEVTDFKDSEGKVLFTGATYQDITERKAEELKLKSFTRTLEERVEERTYLLEQSNRELEQFAYVASHDLREPLRTIASYTQLLGRKLEPSLDESTKKYWTYITEAVERMDQLINDLLSYSRAAKSDVPFEEINTQEVVEAALANLRWAIADSHAMVTVKELPKIFGNSTLLTQLFQNLLGNSIKYSAPQRPPLIEISAKEGDGQWTFALSDNGIGIESRFYDRIFLVFQRLHTRSQYSGTGIGLAICKKIVERHGGRIWVESRLGQGSTFYFTVAHRTVSSRPGFTTDQRKRLETHGRSESS